MRDRPLTPLTLTGSLVGAAVVLWALPQLLGVVFTLGLAVLIALALDAPVSWLGRWLPRSVATSAVVLACIGLLVGAGVLVAPSVADQVRELTHGRQDIFELLVVRIDELSATLPVPLPDVDAAQLREQVMAAPARFSGVIADVGVGVGNLLLAAVLAVWGVARPAPLGARILRFVPPARRDRTARIAGKVERRLRRWLVGQLTVMAAVGVGSYVVFKGLGVPFAELWALLAMLLEAVPAIGVVLAAAGPFLMLLVSDPSALPWLLLGISVVQQAEDRLLVPRVMGRAVELPEALVLAGVLAAGVLFGVGGMVLATPLLAAVVTVHDEMTARRERDAGAGADQARHVAAANIDELVATYAEDPGSGRVAATARRGADDAVVPLF